MTNMSVVSVVCPSVMLQEANDGSKPDVYGTEVKLDVKPSFNRCRGRPYKGKLSMQARIAIEKIRYADRKRNRLSDAKAKLLGRVMEQSE